jgi:hypothetical protein
MDPITLPAGAVALLGLYLARAGDEFPREAGQTALAFSWPCALQLTKAVEDETDERKLLDEFNRERESTSQATQVALQVLMVSDTALKAEVPSLLADVKRLRPQVLVTQRIRAAEDIVGIKARKVRAESSIDVDQEMDKVEHIVGADIDEIG